MDSKKIFEDIESALTEIIEEESQHEEAWRINHDNFILPTKISKCWSLAETENRRLFYGLTWSFIAECSNDEYFFIERHWES